EDGIRDFHVTGVQTCALPIYKENWSQAGTDLKGDAYEQLLSRGASDKGSGAGQYFTPRALIQAIVDVIQPTVEDTVVDPACGTRSEERRVGKGWRWRRASDAS